MTEGLRLETERRARIRRESVEAVARYEATGRAPKGWKVYRGLFNGQELHRFIDGWLYVEYAYRSADDVHDLQSAPHYH